MKTEPSSNDPAREQLRAELAVAAPFVGNFEPRLVFTCLWGLVGWALCATLAVMEILSYWLTVPVASIIVFCLYMPMHEATHDNIRGDVKQLAWVNEMVGWVCSIPLLLDYPSHRIMHMAHHAHTNDSEKDPDFEVAGPLSKALVVSLLQTPILMLVGIAAWVPAARRSLATGFAKGTGENKANKVIVDLRRFNTGVLVIMICMILLGAGFEVLMVWLLPAIIGLGIVSMIFAWLPHHPHNGHGRYTNTRVTLFPGSGLLSRGHDRHIIHHMLPNVPHYHIAPVFGDLQEALEARGTRIEGPNTKTSTKIYIGWDVERNEEIRRAAEEADASNESPPGLEHPFRNNDNLSKGNT